MVSLANQSVFPAAENAGAVTPRTGLLIPGDIRATMHRRMISTLRHEHHNEALSALYFIFSFICVVSFSLFCVLCPKYNTTVHRLLLFSCVATVVTATLLSFNPQGLN